MDAAAAAAAMSDPDRNPLFRRRWCEADFVVVLRLPPPDHRARDALDGPALLLAWRRERERRGDDAP